MKELMENLLAGVNTRDAPGKDGYIATDGLLYCRKCHTPLQCRMEFFGKMRTLNCLCQCGKEALQRKQQAEAEKERMKRIKRLKSAGIQEKYLCDWRFETAKETEIIRWAKRYVQHWKQVREQNLGLLLWGDVGTGKSFVSACIANALLEEAVPVLMTNFSKILNQMGGLYSEERHQYIASFSQYPLLIIDDLGIERSTEYAKEQVYAVLDERYKANLPLITTTNLTIQEIRNPENVMDARIYSRILEMCTPLHVGGGDRRLSVSEKKQEAVKAVLFPKGR